MTTARDIAMNLSDTLLTAHTPACLMSAYAAAAENMRDSDRWRPSHQRLLDWAMGYLDDQLADCSCPVSHRVDAIMDLDRAERVAYRVDDQDMAHRLEAARYGLEQRLPGRDHLGDTLTWRGANGHVWEGPVNGFSPDGHPRAAQWNAGHADSCDCGTWEGEDRSLPDW